MQKESITNQDDLALSKNPLVAWNRYLSSLAIKYKTGLTDLVEQYALLHVSVYDGLLLLENEKDPVSLLIDMISGRVLSYFYPEESEIINKMMGKFSSFQNDDKLCKFVEQMLRTISKVKKNNENYKNSTIPNSGRCKWNGTKPDNPEFSNRSLFIIDKSSIKIPNPHPCAGYKDLKEIQDVIEASNHISSFEISAIHKWSDIPVVTLWNNFLNNRIIFRKMSIKDSAKALAYLNVSIYDACVLCWSVKYKHWTARPVQRIPNFRPVLETPQSPSFVSHHATISAAAHIILKFLFPSESQFFKAQAEEASISTLWAGIQFPNDNSIGMLLGEQVGTMIVVSMEGLDKPIFLQPDDTDLCKSETFNCKSETFNCKNTTNRRKDNVEEEYIEYASIRDIAQRPTYAMTRKRNIKRSYFMPSLNSMGTFNNNSVPLPKYGWRL